MVANRITPTVHETHDRTEAGALPDANPVRDVATLRDGVYRAMQAAIDQYPGGVQQLAEELGAARSDTYLRVARKQDSKGNLYTTETYEGKRLQKFVYRGIASQPRGYQGVLWPVTR